MTNKIPAIIILIIAIAEITLVSFGLFSGWMGPSGTVPILNMDSSIAYLILWVAVPLAGSILAVLLVPRILTPLFMVVKKLIRRGYNDGYVPLDASGLGGRKMMMRLVYVYLLVIGFLTTLMAFFDPLIFLPTGMIPSPVDPQYNISNLFCLAGLATPISVALWSVGWALEDAGLIHYNLPAKDESKLYEIEPVYRSYSSYLKGFAGFSTVLSLAVIFNYFIGIGMFVDAISVFLVPLHSIFVMVPAYFIFALMGSNWLRKNKRAVKQLEDSDLKLYVE